MAPRIMFEGNVQRGRSLGFEGGMFRVEERVAVGMLPRARSSTGLQELG